ncbi:hypothetical protein PC9H_004144 [Pleurotus ostreatus]|uniref:Cytochrome c-type biogenesis protein H TPR domain-containing protein n=1 Tax=Pleurotus ostreatus TaxID=5322 RepID=A0A8H6ZZP8_PLEOS|nr:uncharacterized protein PC9H_004144 [Pleurotus ostreatus]KAF7437305.1 hypothetical protein PC9H_004144 [Pleurotus ostreatus]KAJ8703202.1 glucose repression mediator protein [Pleurotus ostreatus]
MSHRLPRQQDRDTRMHETTPGPVHSQLFSHSQPPPPPPPQHHPHLNGNAAHPTTPLSNGASHSSAIVSPTAIPNTVSNGVGSSSSIAHKLAVANEQTWLLIGRVAEQMTDLDHALSAYENALRHNPVSLAGLTQVAGIARIKENYPKAIDYFQRVLQLQEDNGEVWSALGHCYLMQDDLQKAYSAYQQALYLLPNPKEDPKLWYGIGILYDRYGSLDHAEEAFSSVLRMDKDLDFDKANEILFRLGIIYKQQGKYEESLACFDRILRNPPSPLAHADIWFQIGHVYEQQKDHVRAKDAYERVVADNPSHAKVLQQLGWLYHQDGSSFQNQELAIQYLTKSLEADSSDAQSWYLLGRAYMAGQKYNKAYEAYQQAVYRDGRNPTFWCSIGVLYFQINQFRDALDAYSRAIRINPYISEVWFDLGSLYESCNNQISDAIDAYARASELDPGNHVISQRLQLLKTAQATGGQLPAAPGPQDVHPTAYASAVIPPPGLTGPPLLLQPTSQRPPPFRTDSRGPPNEISLPPPSQVGAGPSSPPFRGGPPPPVVLDESRHVSTHTPLAPMDVDRPMHARDYPPPSSRDLPSRGPVGHTLLLQHPVPQHQIAAEEMRNGAHTSQHGDSYFQRPRVPSRSPTPPQQARRSPFQPYPPPGRQQVGPAQPSAAPAQRSPRVYPHNDPAPRPVEQDGGWGRRPPPAEGREWEHRHHSRQSGDYPPHPSQASFYPPRSPATSSAPRVHSPEPSPRSTHSAHPSRAYWDPKPSPSTAPAQPYRPSPPPPPPPQHHESTPSSRRYDPRFDARDQREYDRDREPSQHEPRGEARYAGPPETLRHPPGPPQPTLSGSESPRNGSSAPEGSEKRKRRSAKEKEADSPMAVVGVPEAGKKETKRRSRAKRTKDDSRDETPKPVGERGYKMGQGYKGVGSPEPTSSNGSGSSRSVQPSPTSAHARPSRDLDEDYDEGVAETLIGLASFRPEAAKPTDSSAHSPSVSTGSRHDPSPRPRHHRDSISSTRSHASPPIPPANLKRPLSPGSDEVSDSKRSRVDAVKRRASSPSNGRRTPTQSTRPSPIPFRTQPATHSPSEARQVVEPYPPSPSLPAVLPPHPRPIGSGHSTSHSASQQMALPPIATLSPASTAASPPAPSERDRDDRMQVDSDSRSISPAAARGKMGETTRSPKGSPGSKAAPTP